MFTLTQDAQERITWATAKGIDVSDTKQGLVEIILDQGIVSYCNENGCVSFDGQDLEEL